MWTCESSAGFFVGIVESDKTWVDPDPEMVGQYDSSDMHKYRIHRVQDNSCTLEPLTIQRGFGNANIAFNTMHIALMQLDEYEYELARQCLYEEEEE